MSRTLYVRCDQCDEPIFGGMEYLADDDLDIVVCDDRCHADYFADNLETIRARHKAIHVTEHDEV